MPLIATRGAASAQGFGEFAQASAPVYIEDVFSTYLYTGNGSTQTITNGIDLSGKGGLVWVKTRTTNTGGGTYNNSNILADSVRTPTYILRTNGTEAQDGSPSFSSFNSNGFTLGTSANTNNTGVNSVSWTFREQPKFFDVVTYTGNGTQGRTISHSLGSVPACIIVKCTSNATAWRVYHTSLGNTKGLRLDSTAAASTSLYYWNNTTPTSTVFTVGDDETVNQSGYTYVAYLFAHDAGGFGLTGLDNVISCGSFTTDGSGNATVSLGYEPQWVMIKQITTAGEDWGVFDNMRGWATGNDRSLYPNLSNVETAEAFGEITATGFVTTRTASKTYIYIAIRRGPMKVPTTGTSVFAPVAYTGTGSAATTTTGFVTDLAIIKSRGVYSPSFEDRLRGANRVLESSGAGAEITTTQYVLGFDTQTGVRIGTDVGVNGSGTTYINWAMRRAPGFFDEVCYTGTGSARTVSHNLAAVPELMIVKKRSGTEDWAVYTASQGNTKFLVLQSTSAVLQSSPTNETWNDTTPTTSVFSVGTSGRTNDPSQTYVAYLFATCAGVSKVGSYTGTGTTQVINCGFTAGSRFILIKRTDSTGDWYVWDSARGIIAGDDPYLLLNSTAAEVTNTDYVDTAATGFEISSTAPAAINANGGTYIFLAIA